MKSSLFRGLVLATIIAVSGALAGAADTKPKVLIDFTRQETDLDGGVPKPIRKYDYSFESWLDKLVFLEGKGILVPSLSGRGGMGKDDRLAFGKSTQCIIEYAVGARNESDSFSFSMVDSDGTDVSWSVGLKDKPRGVPLSITLDLTKPDHEDKPGKKPGFDLAKVKTWQFKGNWQEQKIEVVFIRLSAAAP